MSHALPILMERAAGSCAEERSKASLAITVLLRLSRMKSESKKKEGMSLYLRNILDGNQNHSKPKVITPYSDPAKMSKVSRNTLMLQ